MESTERDLSHARTAAPGEVRRRKNLLVQLGKFLVLNVKMVKMITKGHTPEH